MHHITFNFKALCLFLQIIPSTQASLKPLKQENWGQQPCWNFLFQHNLKHMTRNEHKTASKSNWCWLFSSIFATTCAWLTLSLNTLFTFSNGKPSRYLQCSTSGGCFLEGKGQIFQQLSQSLHLNLLKPDRPAGVPAQMFVQLVTQLCHFIINVGPQSVVLVSAGQNVSVSCSNKLQEEEIGCSCGRSKKLSNLPPKFS